MGSQIQLGYNLWCWTHVCFPSFCLNRTLWSDQITIQINLTLYNIKPQLTISYSLSWIYCTPWLRKSSPGRYQTFLYFLYYHSIIWSSWILKNVCLCWNWSSRCITEYNLQALTIILGLRKKKKTIILGIKSLILGIKSLILGIKSFMP